MPHSSQSPIYDHMEAVLSKVPGMFLLTVAIPGRRPYLYVWRREVTYGRHTHGARLALHVISVPCEIASCVSTRQVSSRSARCRLRPSGVSARVPQRSARRVRVGVRGLWISTRRRRRPPRACTALHLQPCSLQADGCTISRGPRCFWCTIESSSPHKGREHHARSRNELART